MTKRFARILRGFVMAVLLGQAVAFAAEPDPALFNGFRVGGALVPVEAIQRGGPPKDGIPAIDAPRFVPVARASLADGDRVLGVRLAGIARAVTGPMKGARLAPVPLTHTTWEDWRARNPDTVVLSTDTGFTRDYDRDPYAGYDRIQSPMFDARHRDDRFPLEEWVMGVELEGKPKAYPFSVLAPAFDASSGRELDSVTAFWFAWVAFPPRTEVLRAP